MHFLVLHLPSPFLILSSSNCSLLSKSGKSLLSASSLFWHFSITIWFCNSHLLVHVRAFQQLFLLLVFCLFDILLTKSILGFPIHKFFSFFSMWFLNAFHPTSSSSTSFNWLPHCSHGPPTLAHFRTSELYGSSSHLRISYRTGYFNLDFKSNSLFWPCWLCWFCLAGE